MFDSKHRRLYRNTRRKRSLPTKYPSKYMKDEETKTFIVDSREKINCVLVQSVFEATGLKYQKIVYRVLKKENELEGRYTIFYAVAAPAFKKAIRKEHDIENTYENQIAYAQCQPGWIEQIWVNDGETEDTEPINARRCGVASVLTQLCLLDPEIVKLGKSNKALQKLEKHETVLDAIQSHCKEAFVGMIMSANPRDAAYAYFSAALREKYELMMVAERYRDEYHGFPLRWKLPESNFNYYDTKVAKEKYDPRKGRIGTCDCNAFGAIQQNTECHAFEGFWFFCK